MGGHFVQRENVLKVVTRGIDAREQRVGEDPIPDECRDVWVLLYLAVGSRTNDVGEPQRAVEDVCTDAATPKSLPQQGQADRWSRQRCEGHAQKQDVERSLTRLARGSRAALEFRRTLADPGR